MLLQRMFVLTFVATSKTFELGGTRQMFSLDVPTSRDHVFTLEPTETAPIRFVSGSVILQNLHHRAGIYFGKRNI